MVLLNSEKKESGTWRATLLQETGEMIARMEVQGSHKAAARIQATGRSQATCRVGQQPHKTEVTASTGAKGLDPSAVLLRL
jgi:hypothetical protein